MQEFSCKNARQTGSVRSREPGRERLYPSLSVGARARARVGLNELPEKFFSVIYSCRTRQDLHPRVRFRFSFAASPPGKPLLLRKTVYRDRNSVPILF